MIRVLLVDDDPLVRNGLRLLFEAARDLAISAEAGDGLEAIEAVQRHSPDVVLMDLGMDRMDGITATSRIRQLPQPPHVIALTTWDVDDAVMRVLAAGADGFLLKSAPPHDIITAVRSVMAGDAVLSPHSTRHVLDHLATDQDGALRQAARAAMTQLTDRERDVVVAVGRGLSNSEVGSRLYISEATVKAHLSTAQHKLGVRNRVEVAVLAERAGLLLPS